MKMAKWSDSKYRVEVVAVFLKNSHSVHEYLHIVTIRQRLGDKNLKTENVDMQIVIPGLFIISK